MKFSHCSGMTARRHQTENGIANYGHSAQANLIWCTLVHKWQKVGPEFWSTQWEAIATHLVICLKIVILSKLIDWLIVDWTFGLVHCNQCCWMVRSCSVRKQRTTLVVSVLNSYGWQLRGQISGEKWNGLRESSRRHYTTVIALLSGHSQLCKLTCWQWSAVITSCSADTAQTSAEISGATWLVAKEVT